MISQKITKWLKKQEKKHLLKVKIINLSKLNNWKFNKIKIYHQSKKFFQIVGIKVISNFYKNNWDQPIIIQNEVGILGIIKNIKTKKYLLQAKVEPGNINKLQLAPTVQATKSNFSRVHGGNKVPYIEYFLRIKKISRYNQSEQGFRYFHKFNSNILIKNIKNIKKKPDFYWFSKKEIKDLICKKNIINMDTLSVLSSVLKKTKKDHPINTKKKINNWLKTFDKKFYIKAKVINFDKLKDWSVNLKNITHKKKKHFSVIGVNVETNRREVNNWSQPILKGKNMAFAGFIKTKINNTDHYLCRYILKPGLKKSVIGCTINTSDISTYFENTSFNSIEKFFFSKEAKKNIVYDNILSDEGGRFYKCQIRYIISAINYEKVKKIPKNYIWVSYNQIVEMIKNKRLDIESRLLFACNNINFIE